MSHSSDELLERSVFGRKRFRVSKYSSYIPSEPLHQMTGNNGSLPCPLCFKSFSSPRALGGHMRIHGGFVSSSGAMNQKGKSSLSDLRHHIQAEEDDEEETDYGSMEEEENTELCHGSMEEEEKAEVCHGSMEGEEKAEVCHGSMVHQRRRDDSETKIPPSQEKMKTRIKLVFKGKPINHDRRLAYCSSFLSQSSSKCRTGRSYLQIPRFAKKRSKIARNRHRTLNHSKMHAGLDQEGVDEDVLLASQWLLMLKSGRTESGGLDLMSSKCIELSSLDPPPASPNHPSNPMHILANLDSHGEASLASNLKIQDGPAANMDSFMPLPNLMTANNSLEGQCDDGDAPSSRHRAAESSVSNTYQCITCYKCFDSSRALGGHRASCHKKGKMIATSGQYSNLGNKNTMNYMVATLGSHRRNALDTEIEIVEEQGVITQHTGGHLCSICHRVFATGQALGGHKRCHWNGGEKPISMSNLYNDSHSMVASMSTASTSGERHEIHDLSLHPLEEEEEEEEEEVPEGKEESKASMVHHQGKNLDFDLNFPAPGEENDDLNEEMRSNSCNDDKFGQVSTLPEPSNSLVPDMNVIMTTLMDIEDDVGQCGGALRNHYRYSAAWISLNRDMKPNSVPDVDTHMPKMDTDTTADISRDGRVGLAPYNSWKPLSDEQLWSKHDHQAGPHFLATRQPF